MELNDIKLPDRSGVTNKGDAGRVLIIGGGVGMCGAAAFAAEAAYRTGCGLVKVYTHCENRIPMQTLVPEAVLSFWEDSFDTPILDASLKWADSVLIGVGFGCGEKQVKILKKVLTSSAKPIVIDADALNIISAYPSLMSCVPEGSVLTPHLAELSRLTGYSIEDIKANTLRILREQFLDKRINVAAKSASTFILTSFGDECMSSTGDSSLSTGGTGDILAGMIASLIAQKMSPDIALITAVQLHGMAGRIAGEKLGVRSVIARDVISALPDVLKEY